MKTRSITVLAVILALLGGIYYVDYNRLVEQREASSKSEQLLPFAVDTLTSIAVNSPQGDYRLEKRGGVWWIVDPIQERASQSVVVEGILSSLGESFRMGEFEYAESEAKGLGLADPDLKVVLTGKSGDLRMEFGKESPLRGKAYVSFSKGEAWVTAVSVRRALTKKLLELRDKKVFSRKFEQLRQVVVQDKSTTSPLTLTREASGDWMIRVREAEEGSTVSMVNSYKADPQGVNDFFMLVDAMKAIDSVTSDSLQRSLRTSQTPHFIVQFDFAADGATSSSSVFQSTTLLLRVPRAPDDLTVLSPNALLPGTYCATMLGRAGLVYEVENALMQKVRFPKVTFRDRSIITLGMDEIDSVSMAWRAVDLEIDNTVDLSRGEKREWHLTYGYDTLVHQARVDQYLDFCLKQKVGSFELKSVPKSAVEAGLAEPAFRIEMRSGNRVDGFEVGGRIHPSDPYYYARRIMGTGVNVVRSEMFMMVMPDPFIQALRKTNRNFISQPLLTFQREELREVVVAMGGASTISLMLQPEVSDQWQGLYPGGTSKTLTANVMDPFLDFLRDMEYSVLARNVTPELLEKSGMMPPPIALFMRGEGGKTLCAMFFPPVLADKEERLMLVTDHLGRYMYVAKNEMIRLQKVLGAVVARLR